MHTHKDYCPVQNSNYNWYIVQLHNPVWGLKNVQINFKRAHFMFLYYRIKPVDGKKQ